KALARWWPQKGSADLREANDDALDYMIKQMTPQAAYALRFRVRREKQSRHDLAKVAAVLGSRVGMTRNLATIVRTAESGVEASGLKRGSGGRSNDRAARRERRHRSRYTPASVGKPVKRADI